MGSLFIAGNGFDIAHGISSSYGDFRKFLIKRFPEALEYRDKIIFVEDCENIDVQEFAAEILISTMDKVSGINWSNFEEALAHIDFSDKLPKPNHKEDETDEEDRALMQKYLLYMDVLTNAFIYCTKYWQIFFQAWLKEVEMQVKSNILCKDSLKTLFNESDMMYFSFNYTTTLEKIYGIKKVTHIHNSIGKKLIFGHGEDDATYSAYDETSSFGSSFLDDMIMKFKKDTDSSIKKNKGFFKRIDYNIDKVYSYGFSYGKVDSVYIKRIIHSISPDAVWHFTAFEAKDKEALRIKKIKLRNYGFKGRFYIYEG